MMPAKQTTREQQAIDRRTWLLSSTLALTSGLAGTAQAGGWLRRRHHASACRRVVCPPYSAPASYSADITFTRPYPCGTTLPVVNGFTAINGTAVHNSGWDLWEVYGGVFPDGQSPPSTAPWDQAISDSLSPPCWEHWTLSGADCEYMMPYPGNYAQVWAEFANPNSMEENDVQSATCAFKGMCQDTIYEIGPNTDLTRMRGRAGQPPIGVAPPATAPLVVARRNPAVPQQPVLTDEGRIYRQLWLGNRHYGNELRDGSTHLEARVIRVWTPTVNWRRREGTGWVHYVDSEGRTSSTNPVEALETPRDHWRFPSRINGMTTYQYGICIWQANGGWHQLPSSATDYDHRHEITLNRPGEPIYVQVNGRRYQFGGHRPHAGTGQSIDLGVEWVS